MGHGAIRDQLLERTNGTPLALTLKVKHCATASEKACLWNRSLCRSAAGLPVALGFVSLGHGSWSRG